MTQTEELKWLEDTASQVELTPVYSKWLSFVFLGAYRDTMTSVYTSWLRDTVLFYTILQLAVGSPFLRAEGLLITSKVQQKDPP